MHGSLSGGIGGRAWNPKVSPAAALLAVAVASGAPMLLPVLTDAM
ncbi:hypothetical protein [Parafrigoribacterium mesophilum]